MSHASSFLYVYVPLRKFMALENWTTWKNNNVKTHCEFPLNWNTSGIPIILLWYKVLHTCVTFSSYNFFHSSFNEFANTINILSDTHTYKICWRIHLFISGLCDCIIAQQHNTQNKRKKEMVKHHQAHTINHEHTPNLEAQ